MAQLSQFNPDNVRTRTGQLYLFNYPTANPAAPAGSGATATAVLSSNTVGSVTVSAGGTLYNAPPLISFTGGSGTGAAAVATVVGGIVTAITVTNPGTGYVSAPTVVITPQPSLLAADIVKGFLQQVFLDGNKMTTLNSGVLPWAILDKNGLKLDWKYKAVMAATNLPQPDINAGQYPESMAGEITILDPSAAKIAEALSVLTGQQIIIPAGTGQAGKQILLLGPQVYATRYSMIFKSTSKNFIGESDNYLMPRCTIDPQISIELTKDKLYEVKLKVMAEGDKYLLDPVTGYPVASVLIDTTAAAQ